MTTKTPTAPRIRGYAAVDNDGAIIGRYCVDCADIDWLHSDPGFGGYLEDEYGNQLLRAARPFTCDGCGEEC